MIKKILLSIGLFGLGIINFSSAYIGNNCEFTTNGSVSSLDVNVLTHGGLITQQVGVTKKVFFISQLDYFFWTTDNLPYGVITSSSSDYYQGYYKRYRLCDLITSDTNSNGQLIEPSNCSLVNFDGVNFDSLRSFLDSITCNDTYFYRRRSSPTATWFCMNSSSYGKSLCFYVRVGSYASQDFSGTLNIPNNFTNSFDSLDISLLGDPPGWGGGGGSVSTGGVGTGITLECTKQNALNRYNKNGYTSKLCYGGYDDFVINDGTPLGYLPFWGSGLDYQEIWLETANLLQGGSTGSATSLDSWFIYWRAMYDLYKRGGFDVNPFINTPWVLFTYFGAVETYGRTFLSKDIIEYCDLLLYTSDYSVGYSGLNVDKVCTRSNLLDDYNSNLSGDNLNIGINTNGSGENIQNITDGTDFINKYWSVLKDNFSQAVENTNGVIPLYIQLALIGLILFRFISH